MLKQKQNSNKNTTTKKRKSGKIIPTDTTEIHKHRRKLKQKEETSSHSCGQHGLRRSTQLLIQITNGKDWRKSGTPSPNKCPSSLSEQGCEMECEEAGRGKIRVEYERSPPSNTGIKMKKFERAPDPSTAALPSAITESPSLTKVQILEPPLAHHDSTAVGTKEGNHLFGRITDRAAKYLPKKSNFGKFFGEKEASNSNIQITTIDREMAKHSKIQPKLRVNHQHKTEFSNSELTDRLRRTKLPVDDNNPRSKTVGSLALDYPPYRLYFLPSEDWRDPDSLVNTIIRLVLCQTSLILFLLMWIVFGALVFHLIEGPYEYHTAMTFEKEERSLAVSLATDLRLLDPEESSWMETIEKYTSLHRDVVINSVEYSYGNQKFFWTYPGSLLFATSLLTTLGIATPFPLTGGGKLGAFIFTALGFPMHVLLLVHLGRTIALKVQLLSLDIEERIYELRRKISNVRKFGEDIGQDKEQWPERYFTDHFKPPAWLCHIPLLTIILYYIFGSLIFGLWQGFPSLFLFPSNFSSTTHYSSDVARIGYACFLEGFAILIAINISLWRDSPYQGFANVGTKLRFMTNSLD